jgi:hypothetical protein
VLRHGKRRKAAQLQPRQLLLQRVDLTLLPLGVAAPEVDPKESVFEKPWLSHFRGSRVKI